LEVNNFYFQTTIRRLEKSGKVPEKRRFLRTIPPGNHRTTIFLKFRRPFRKNGENWLRFLNFSLKIAS